MFEELWPGFEAAEVPIGSITNGVHGPTWAAPEWLDLGRELAGSAEPWREPWEWQRINQLDAGHIWSIRCLLRAKLVADVRRRLRESWLQRGAIETEGWAVYSEQARSRYPRTNPMMRAGSPWEIAEACVFLGGPGGSFINGETLVVDGGGQHWGEVWTTGKPEYYAAATRVWDDGGTTQDG